MSNGSDIDDFKTGSDYNEQYEYQELEDDERDAAWEEYLSTGIDPTGGELGPDFDPETGEDLPEEEVQDDWYERINTAIDRKMAEVDAYERAKHNTNTPAPQEPNLRAIIITIVCIAILLVIGISALEKSHHEKAVREQIERYNAEYERQKELERQRQESERIMNGHVKTPEEIDAEKRATREEVQRLLNSGRGLYGQGVTPNTAGKPAQVQSNLPKRGTPYGDGYWDGYEEGYDDADGHNQYGFKYDESTNKYSGKALSEYVRGYQKGYKVGWEEGQEDLENRFDMGDPEIDEGDW